MTPDPSAPHALDAIPRPPLRVWVSPIAWLVTLVLVLYFFQPLSTVMLGILAACIIACTLYPLMDWIPGPRGLDVAVLALALLLIFGGAIFAFSWPLAEPFSRLMAKWPETAKLIDESLAKVSAAFQLAKPLTGEDLFSRLGDFLAGTGGTAIFSRSADLVLGVGVALVFALIGSVFLLTEPPEVIINPVLRLLSPEHRPRLTAALEDLGPRYRRWVIGTLTGMCIVFTASLIGYSAIGLELALALAIVAGLAEIVPTVGPAISALVALLVAAATQGAGKAAGVLVVYGIVQALEAYLILPLIMRGAVNIHPAVTLFSVVLWGKIFGLPGLMLAIPINLTLWTLLVHFRINPRDEADATASSDGAGRVPFMAPAKNSS